MNPSRDAASQLRSDGSQVGRLSSPPPRSSRLRPALACLLLLSASGIAGCGEREDPIKKMVADAVADIDAELGIGPPHFVSSEEALFAATPSLQRHYVPFELDVPKTWVYEEGGVKPTRANFVKLHRNAREHTTAENFTVGSFWVTLPPGPEAEAQITVALRNVETSISQSFSNVKIVDQVTRTVNARPARGFRFSMQATPEETGGAPLDGWGMVLVVPYIRGTDGLSIILYATAADPQFTSVDDIGVKGDAPAILASLEFGK